MKRRTKRISNGFRQQTERSCHNVNVETDAIVSRIGSSGSLFSNYSLMALLRFDCSSVYNSSVFSDKGCWRAGGSNSYPPPL